MINMMDVTDVITNLEALANKLDASDKHAAARLRDLSYAVGGGPYADAWAASDIHQLIKPDMIIEAYKTQRRTESVIAVIEWIRNSLIFAPLVVTWYGRSQAVEQYSALIKADPGQITQPFLYLWQLGLMIIFFVSIPGAQPRPIVVPTLIVSPRNLDPSSSSCTGGIKQPRCTVTVGETVASLGSMIWTASSDISDTIHFSPASGNLSPGESMTITISVLPCQNGSFTFSGSRGANPVTIAWHCKPVQERLDFNYQGFVLTVHDINGLLTNSQSAINDIKQQLRREPILQRGSVGLAVVYGGAPGDADIGQAQTVAQKIYNILAMLGKEGFAFQIASYYVPLYTLGAPSDVVHIDVYLYR